MKKTLYIMCGIPGSGKSYWATKHIKDMAGKVAYVSRDEVRFSIISDEDEYFSKEKEVFAKFVSLIKEDLNEYDTVIADATHLNIASRTKLLNALGDSLKDVSVIAMVIKTDLNTAIERNATREGREFVPLSVIRRMNFQMTIPTLEEGFDEVWVYKNNKYSITKGVD